LVQRVLKEAGEADIAIYVVWEPIWGEEMDARMTKAKAIISDPRIKQYRVDSLEVGDAFSNALRWKLGGPNRASGKTPWDVYLLYPGDAQWDDGPPVPYAWASPVVRGKLGEELSRLSAGEQACRSTRACLWAPPTSSFGVARLAISSSLERA
jgi:hypothetical protein